MTSTNVGILKSNELEECTCCNDVFKLLTYEGDCTKRNYSLYKICNLRNFNGWSYIMQIERDEFPVPLTEEEVNSFLEDPEKGEKLAYNIWMDRYR